MQYFFNFGIDIYNVIMIVIPFFCYITACILGIAGVLVFARMGDDRRIARGEVVLATASLLLAFILTNYAGFVNLLQHSFGFTAHTVTRGGGILLYQNTIPTTIAGTNPVQLTITVIQLLWRFFAAVGLLFCLQALMKYRRVAIDQAVGLWTATVMLACGTFLLNIDVWAIGILQQYA